MGPGALGGMREAPAGVCRAPFPVPLRVSVAEL